MENLLERALRRPVGARDRILRATSQDGLTWSRDTSFVLARPALRGRPMTYYAAVDDRGALWARASVHDGSGGWHTELGRDGEWRRADRYVSAEHLYGISWSGNRMYAVAESAGDRTIVCLRRDRDGWPAASKPQRWEGLEGLRVEDVCVVRSGETFRAWCSVVGSPASTSIHAWTSADGQRWEHRGRSLASPHEDHWFQLANNPSVVALPGGGWRMYFRTGRAPALGNTIRSAVSGDLADWRHEPGARMSPSGPWAGAGVAFPHVVREGEAFTMYYTGYWGRSRAAAAYVERWGRLGDELKRSVD